jgi:hypothetical protein
MQLMPNEVHIIINTGASLSITNFKSDFISSTIQFCLKSFQDLQQDYMWKALVMRATLLKLM